MSGSSSRGNPMIMLGLIAAVFLLILAIILSSSRPSESLKKLSLASGEWPPYTSESLPDHGVASAVVDYVFTQMGYQTQIQFSPWTLALEQAEQAQRSDQIRGVYPYMYSDARAKRFYFSDPVIDIANVFFFRRESNLTQEPIEIQQLEDLEKYAVLTLQGYEYRDEIRQFLLNAPCDFVDNVAGVKALSNDFPWVLWVSEPIEKTTFDQAFTSDEAQRLTLAPGFTQLHQFESSVITGPSWPKGGQYYRFSMPGEQPQVLPQSGVNLIYFAPKQETRADNSPAFSHCEQTTLAEALIALVYYSKPNVLLEAKLVGESLVANQFPSLASVIAQSEYIATTPNRVMFSKNNPDNLGLRDEFNKRLNQLRQNQQAYNKLINNTLNKISLANAVALVTASGEELIIGYLFDPQSQSCRFNEPLYFPKGSKATIRNWSKILLPTMQAKQQNYVVAELLNGPMSSKKAQYCFAPSAIELQ